MNEPLPDLETLAEELLDASVVEEFEARLQRAVVAVDADHDTLAGMDRFRYRLLFFDVSLVSTTDRVLQIAMAEALLGAAIEEGDDAWAGVLATNRLRELERLAAGQDPSLDLLELLSYSPDPGTRTFALVAIEAQGMRRLDAGLDSRPIERLLHGRGARDTAYRLETLRKRRLAKELAWTAEITPVGSLPNLRRLAIAGGHAQLRATAAALLEEYGVKVVQIPSSQESVRRERDVVHALQGCDAAMVLVRHITHSTSDQVRRAAERLGIPVIFSNALSAVAIERQLLERAT